MKNKKIRVSVVLAAVLLAFVFALICSRCLAVSTFSMTSPEIAVKEADVDVEATEAIVTESPLSIEEKVKSKIAGKNISILGDSISTFCLGGDSWSNNQEYNTTIAGNDVWYNSQQRLKSVDDTYWKIIIDRFSLNLVVNNSYSGNLMMDSAWGNAGFIRAEELHANTDGMNPKGTKPDIIIIYLGTNDYDLNRHIGTADDIDTNNYVMDDEGKFQSYRVKSFIDAYAYAIYKINCLYDEPDIFVITLLPNGMMPESIVPGLRGKYNDAIKYMSQLYSNVTVVDLDADSQISTENYYKYYADRCLHPNEEGMKSIADAVFKAFERRYV